MNKYIPTNNRYSKALKLGMKTITLLQYELNLRKTILTNKNSMKNLFKLNRCVHIFFLKEILFFQNKRLITFWLLLF